MEYITLAHGDGGTLTRRLLEEIFLPAFGTANPDKLTDASPITVSSGKLALTTDSFVIHPLFFPGGNIGRLAVSGTINDLAVSGADPLYLTAGFIMEEGLPLAELQSIVSSMGREAAEAGINIIAGDTKVVEKNKGDGLYINTTGAGFLPHNCLLTGENVKPGDAVLINGAIGCHGVAVLSRREGIGFETSVESDCACLHRLTGELRDKLKNRLKFMRDPTRGGLATTLKETARLTGYDIVLEENNLPVPSEVKGACELLGLDPLYLANEGKVTAVVEQSSAAEALEIIHRHQPENPARIIGQITRAVSPGNKAGKVFLQTSYGGTRELDFLAENPQPRIC